MRREGRNVDQSRFEELKKKKGSGEGLTDAEANELGRMLAEEQGVPYQSADDLREQEADRAKEPGEGIADEHRPETAVRDAEAQPAPEQDKPAGARPPLGARSQQSKTEG
jgi:hypothetical protein